MVVMKCSTQLLIYTTITEEYNPAYVGGREGGREITFIAKCSKEENKPLHHTKFDDLASLLSFSFLSRRCLWIVHDGLCWQISYKQNINQASLKIEVGFYLCVLYDLAVRKGLWQIMVGCQLHIAGCFSKLLSDYRSQEAVSFMYVYDEVMR